MNKFNLCHIITNNNITEEGIKKAKYLLINSNGEILAYSNCWKTITEIDKKVIKGKYIKNQWNKKIYISR